MSYDLAVELAAALIAAMRELDGIGSAEGGLVELWSPEIIGDMEELKALRLTMRRAVELMPDHRPELVELFTKERAAAHWEPPPFPPLSLLPEIVDRVEGTLEHLRRERLLDRDLDEACKRVLDE